MTNKIIEQFEVRNWQFEIIAGGNDKRILARALKNGEETTHRFFYHNNGEICDVKDAETAAKNYLQGLIDLFLSHKAILTSDYE